MAEKNLGEADQNPPPCRTARVKERGLTFSNKTVSVKNALKSRSCLCKTNSELNGTNHCF